MLVGGIALAFDDPGGLALAAMGVVFTAAGYLARRLFATPPGMKAVGVSAMRAGIVTRHGRRGVRTQQNIIHVDANATDAEIEAQRAAWLAAELDARADWRAGRVQDQGRRSGTRPYRAAGAWVLFAGALSAAAIFWDSNLWPFAGIAVLMATGFGVYAVREAWRRSKFSPSHFETDSLPARLGSRLTGEVQTGIDQRLRRDGPFEVTLRCLHRWEERDHERRTHLRVDVLWE